MSDVSELNAHADQAAEPQELQTRHRNGRKRRWPLRLAWLSFGLVVGWIVLAQTVTPLEAGSSWSELRCDPQPASEDVSDIFGGGGVIVDYAEGASCELFFSVVNPSFVPVAIVQAERTPDYWRGPLLIQEARISRAAYGEELNSIGFPDDEVELTATVVGSGQEWGIRLLGMMANCRPPTPEDGAIFNSTRHTEFRVRVLGIPRVVEVELQRGYAVAHDGCGID